MPQFGDLSLPANLAVFAAAAAVVWLAGTRIAAALLGVVVTGIYPAGPIERRDRVVLRMGVDSLLVLLVYLGGLVLLYRLRP